MLSSLQIIYGSLFIYNAYRYMHILIALFIYVWFLFLYITIQAKANNHANNDIKTNITLPYKSTDSI